MIGGILSGSITDLAETQTQRDFADLIADHWKSYFIRHFYNASTFMTLDETCLHCSSCGAPYSSSDSACSYCKTVRP